MSANDIYLEDDTKQVKAVCASHDIAILLASYANDAQKESKKSEIVEMLLKRLVCSRSEMLDEVTVDALHKCLGQIADDVDDSMPVNAKKTKGIVKLVKESFYLCIAMDKAQIPVKDVQTAMLQQQFQNFYNALNAVISDNNIEIEKKAEQDLCQPFAEYEELKVEDAQNCISNGTISAGIVSCESPNGISSESIQPESTEDADESQLSCTTETLSSRHDSDI